MKNCYLLLVLLSVSFILFNCTTKDPNISEDGLDPIERNSIASNIQQGFGDTTYISAYSEIYTKSRLRTIPLTIILSIRSGSFTDTTVINAITFYDTEGNIIKEYLKKPVYLKPMQSLDYIVGIPQQNEEIQKSRGGIGAHFIVQWGARINTQPIMQCVMLGAHANNSVSFVTSGKSIATRNVK